MAMIPTWPWVSAPKFMWKKNHKLLDGVSTVIMASTFLLDDFQVCFHNSEAAEAINNCNINYMWIQHSSIAEPGSPQGQCSQTRFLEPHFPPPLVSLCQMSNSQLRFGEKKKIRGKLDVPPPFMKELYCGKLPYFGKSTVGMRNKAEERKKFSHWDLPPPSHAYQLFSDKYIYCVRQNG